MTEREALAVVQEMAGSGKWDRDTEAICTLLLANRVHMQQLKDRLDQIKGDNDLVELG